jgi:hypothetical protein
VVDPFLPPLPANITTDQALNFAKSVARGTPDRNKIVKSLVSEKVRELV